MTTLVRRVTGAGGETFSIQMKDFSYHLPQSARRYKPIACILEDANSTWDHDASHAFTSEIINIFDPGEIPMLHFFDAANSSRVLQSTALHYLETHPFDYDIVVTFGERVALEVRNFQERFPGRCRQVFVGVTDVVTSGLLVNPTQSTHDVSGVIRQTPQYEELARLLQAVRPPEVSRLFYIVDGRQSAYAALERPMYKAFAQHGYQITPVKLYPDSLVKEQLGATLSSTDIVCSDFSSGIMRHTKTLIELCNERGATMTTGDLTGVKYGAAFGSGGLATSYGVMAGRIVHEALFCNTPFRQIGVAVITESSEVVFNRRALEKQGIVLTDIQNSLMNAYQIFSTSSLG